MDRDNSAVSTPEDLVKKNIQENKNNGKQIKLSSLTAKYNRSRNVGEVFLSDNKNALSNETSLSDDDCSETEPSSALSLAALVAKHNVNKTLHTRPETTSLKESTFGNQQDKVKFGDFSDHCSSDSDNGGSSLLSFALKHSHTIQPNNLSLKTDNSICKDIGSEACDKDNSTISDLTLKFKAANFSGDSDSDNSSNAFSIAKPVLHEYSVDLPKPRELLALAKGHRQHSKSESDRSYTQITSSDLVGTSNEKEISTSLGNLRGNSHDQTDFQFSLGCAIPNSFRSKNASPLSISLSSFQSLSRNDVKNSFSDPDISSNMKKYTDCAKKDSNLMPHSDKSPGIDGCEIGGIDLFSAIKSFSNTKINDSENQNVTNSMNISNDNDDEKIVTLLDTLCVDEEMVNNDDPANNKLDCYGITNFANTSNDSCVQDASFLLDLRLNLETEKCSSLGNVISRRQHAIRTPYIRSEKLHNPIVPFDFSSPSPDDVINSYRRQ